MVACIEELSHEDFPSQKVASEDVNTSPAVGMQVDVASQVTITISGRPMVCVSPAISQFV
jgi:beta-lactam-binding protein with PASTA domain